MDKSLRLTFWTTLYRQTNLYSESSRSFSAQIFGKSGSIYAMINGPYISSYIRFHPSAKSSCVLELLRCCCGLYVIFVGAGGDGDCVYGETSGEIHRSGEISSLSVDISSKRSRALESTDMKKVA